MIAMLLHQPLVYAKNKINEFLWYLSATTFFLRIDSAHKWTRTFFCNKICTQICFGPNRNNQRYQTFSAVNPSSFSVRSGNFQCNPSCSPVVYLMIAMLLHQPLFCAESINTNFCRLLQIGLPIF